MDTKTTADVFREAKDVLRSSGWCQGAFRNYDSGAVCVAGAINVALTGSASYAPQKALDARSVLAKIAGAADLAEWNDDPRRTLDEVMALFDKGIDLAERS